jgi:hypothetical protein
VIYSVHLKGKHERLRRTLGPAVLKFRAGLPANHAVGGLPLAAWPDINRKLGGIYLAAGPGITELTAFLVSSIRRYWSENLAALSDLRTPQAVKP